MEGMSMWEIRHRQKDNKTVMKKEGTKIWTGFNWLGIQFIDRPCKHGNDYQVPAS
jgi:hypothetical protein